MLKLLLFDIDHTLIDTDLLYQFLNQKLTTTTGVSGQLFKKIDAQYKNSLSYSNDFNSENYLAHIAKSFNANLNLLKKAYYNQPAIYQKSLFTETFLTLKTLAEKNSLGIFSEGFVKFQTLKLTQTNLINFFTPKHIYILRRKLEDKVLLNLPAGTWLVDDNLLVVEEIFRKNHLIPIWLNRKTRQKHKKAKTIHNLAEILEVI